MSAIAWGLVVGVCICGGLCIVLGVLSAVGYFDDPE